MKKIYLAARYTRRAELAEYAERLRNHGFQVTSRWLNGDHDIPETGSGDDADCSFRRRFAQEDWDDLMEAEIVISWTENPHAENSRGGRHFEFGAAIAAGKVCIIVGPRENVFHCLDQVIQMEQEYFDKQIAFFLNMLDVMKPQIEDFKAQRDLQE